MTTKTKSKTKATIEANWEEKTVTTSTQGKKSNSKREKSCEASKSADRSKKRGELNKELGRRGEAAAVRFLERHDYEIIDRNWTCPAGEADIIALDDDAVVFVEVKTRSSTEMGFPSDAVDAKKREKYEKIAAMFLMNYDVIDVQVRFDIISIVVVSPDRALIRHHINAWGVA
jgi:putative endonuclease